MPVWRDLSSEDSGVEVVEECGFDAVGFDSDVVGPSVPVVPNHLAGTDPTSIAICALREAVHGCGWFLVLSLYQALGKKTSNSSISCTCLLPPGCQLRL